MKRRETAGKTHDDTEQNTTMGTPAPKRQANYQKLANKT